MIFSGPVPFHEAIKSRAARALMPTTLTSKELSRIRPELAEASTFSAQTSNAKQVKAIADSIDKILAPEGGIDMATVMSKLRDVAKGLGYDPDGSKSITNLASDQRLRLVVEFNSQRARAAGQFAQRQDQGSLDQYPAQEFYRQEDRIEIRDWPTKWQELGGQFFDGASDYKEGRMIALVNDPIWEALSEFGVPYAPFAFGSGMNVRPIERQEAEELGLIEHNEQIIPEPLEYPDEQTSMEDMDPEMEAQILADLGPDYGFVDTDEGRVLQKL